MGPLHLSGWRGSPMDVNGPVSPQRRLPDWVQVRWEPAPRLALLLGRIERRAGGGIAGVPRPVEAGVDVAEPDAELGLAEPVLPHLAQERRQRFGRVLWLVAQQGPRLGRRDLSIIECRMAERGRTEGRSTALG